MTPEKEPERNNISHQSTEEMNISSSSSDPVNCSSDSFNSSPSDSQKSTARSVKKEREEGMKFVNKQKEVKICEEKEEKDCEGDGYQALTDAMILKQLQKYICDKGFDPSEAPKCFITFMRDYLGLRQPETYYELVENRIDNLKYEFLDNYCNPHFSKEADEVFMLAEKIWRSGMPIYFPNFLTGCLDEKMSIASNKPEDQEEKIEEVSGSLYSVDSSTEAMNICSSSPDSFYSSYSGSLKSTGRSVMKEGIRSPNEVKVCEEEDGYPEDRWSVNNQNEICKKKEKREEGEEIE